MKTVLLDWDGVLADSTAMYYDVYCKLCTHYRKYLPIHSVAEFRSWYNPAWENNYLEMGFTLDDLPIIADFIHANINYDPIAIYAGTKEVLQDLSASYTLAIVSTTPSATIRTRLQQESLDQYISYISGEGTKSDKAERIASTLELLHCQQAVMVGDTPLDIVAGKANNLPTIGATYGWITPERVRQSQPSALINDISELPDAVRSLLK